MAIKNRDNFSRKTINMLAERVGFICSNPNCACHTVGPNQQPDKSTRIGKGAHITDAAAGPRYDAVSTPAMRSAIDNGIWLCSNCADLIDKDEQAYPASLEHQASARIKAKHAIQTDEFTPGPYLEGDLVFVQSTRSPGEYL